MLEMLLKGNFYHHQARVFPIYFTLRHISEHESPLLPLLDKIPSQLVDAGMTFDELIGVESNTSE